MKSAAILVLSLAAQLFVLGEDQSPSLPGWLSNFPQTTALSETRLPDSVRVFYETIAPMAAVITHYQEQLRKAQIASTTTDYGTGKTISARTIGVSCDARVIAVDGGSRVWVVCTPGNDGKQPAPASKGKESCIARIFGDAPARLLPTASRKSLRAPRCRQSDSAPQTQAQISTRSSTR